MSFRLLSTSFGVLALGVVVLRCGGSGPPDDGLDADTDSASHDSAADTSTGADSSSDADAATTPDAGGDSGDGASAPDSSCTGAGDCDNVNPCPSSQQCCKTVPTNACGFCFKGSICPP